MLIDEIKKANMEALKNHDSNARAIFSVVINKYMLVNIENKTKGIESNDTHLIQVISKISKELDEEIKQYLDAGRNETAEQIKKQKEIISKYLPKMMSEDEIKAEISKLADKTMPSIMKHFKVNFAGKVDMSIVSRIAREIK